LEIEGILVQGEVPGAGGLCSSELEGVGRHGV